MAPLRVMLPDSIHSPCYGPVYMLSNPADRVSWAGLLHITFPQAGSSIMLVTEVCGRMKTGPGCEILIS
jgi:hypothetical protein